MLPEPPNGQRPVDPTGAFAPPPAPGQMPAGGPGMPPPPPGWIPSPPPGWMPPPQMMPMMYPQPQRRSFSRAIFLTLATTIFCFSLLANIYLLILTGIMGGSGQAGQVLEAGKSNEKIVIIPIHGVITEATAVQVNQWLKEADADSNVRAVILDIDTPGGTVSASDQIHNQVERLRANGKKVVVAMGAYATSGGYYIACRADHIVAQQTTLTGNIGVIAQRVNVSDMLSKWGVRETTLTAPANGFKNAGSMLSPEDPKADAYLQELIDSFFDRFATLVKEGRTIGGDPLKSKLKGKDEEIFNGAVFTAKQAQANGLIDQIGYIDDAVTWVKAAAGLNNPTIVRMKSPPSLFDVLFASSDISPKAQAGVNVNITLDPALIDQMSMPRMMYLWRGQ